MTAEFRRDPRWAVTAPRCAAPVAARPDGTTVPVRPLGQPRCRRVGGLVLLVSGLLALPVGAASFSSPAVTVPTSGVEDSAGPATVEARHLGVGVSGAAQAGGFGEPAVAGVVVAREVGLAPFGLIGASWEDEEVDVHAAVRLRLADGTWTAWQDLADGGAGPEGAEGAAGAQVTGGARVAAEPVWVGSADGYEIIFEDGAGPDGLEVHVVRLDAPRRGSPEAPGAATASASAASAPLPSAGEVPAPPVLGRASWGAQPAAGPMSAATAVRLAVVHHTADVEPYGYAPEDVPGILRAIQAYHQGLGWSDIGYNFVVDRFGRTWEARGGGAATPVIGAHAYGFNTASMGVAVLGDFSAVGGNGPMADALAGLIAWKLYLSGSDPATPATVLARSTDRHEAGALLSLPRVVGHGDLNHTACPADLRHLLDGLNGAVSARYRAMDGVTGTSAAPGPAAPAGATPWPGDFDGDGRTDVLWHRPGDPHKVFWHGSSTGAPTISSQAMDPAFEPVLGDFDGDGTTDVYWWSAVEAGDGIWMGQGSGTPQFRPQPVSGPGRPTVFDGDGDGDGDLLWYEPSTGAASVWRSLGPDGFAVRAVTAPPGARPIALDLDGDTRQDLLWYRAGHTSHEVWTSTGDLSFTTSTASLPADREPAVGDVDGDGRDDLVLSGPEGARIWWQGVAAAGDDLPLAGTHTVAVADLTGGGRDDVVLARADGHVLQWYGSADRTLYHRDGTAPAGARPVVGDLNGDARADVLWYQVATGATEVWTTTSGFTGVVPGRLLDTRPGASTADGVAAGGGALAAGGTLELQVTGRGGVPEDVDAVVLNLTATEASGFGFLTAYPCGGPRPLASNLNYRAGETAPNLAVVKVGTGGRVCLFAASSSVDLIADVAGYFPSGSFAGLPPARLLDTRPVGATVDGLSVGGGPVPAGGVVRLAVGGRGGVAEHASAVVLNVTATEAAGPGYATVWPCSQPRPLASNLNYGAGDTIPNLVFVKLGPGEQVCVFTASSPVHLVADVSGYVPVGAPFVGLNPARLADTRPAGATVDGVAVGAGARPGNGTYELTVAGRGGVPADASAVVLNVTATEGAGDGFVTVWPCGGPLPLASNLNYGAGTTRPNLTLVQVGDGGKVCLFTATSPVHLVVDAAGYFPGP